MILSDVGPVTRQFLTRADNFFNGLEGLTLRHKLVRVQVPERAMRAALLMVELPRLDEDLRLGKRG